MLSLSVLHRYDGRTAPLLRIDGRQIAEARKEGAPEEPGDRPRNLNNLEGEREHD